MTDLFLNALAIVRQAKSSTSEALSALDALAGTTPDMRAALMQVRGKLAALQDVHLELAHMLLHIERRQKTIDSMKFEHPVYWRTSATGAREGPFCPACWDGKQVATPLNSLPFREHDRWVCRNCSKTFFSASARAAMEAAERSADNERRGRPGGVQVDE